MFPPVVVPGQMADELTAPSSYVNVWSASAAFSYTVPANKVLAIFSVYLSNSPSSLQIGGVAVLNPQNTSIAYQICSRNKFAAFGNGNIYPLNYGATPATTSQVGSVNGNSYSVADAPFLFLAGPGTVISVAGGSPNPSVHILGALYDA